MSIYDLYLYVRLFVTNNPCCVFRSVFRKLIQEQEVSTRRICMRDVFHQFGLISKQPKWPRRSPPPPPVCCGHVFICLLGDQQRRRGRRHRRCGRDVT